MTTRRDVLTGLAALPILPAATGAAEAAPAAAHTVFLHEIDRQLAREIDTMEQLLGRMKDRLAVANHPNPMIRSGALLDMRCSFTALCITADFARQQIEAQRIDAEGAAQAEKVRRNLKAYYDESAAEAGA